MSTSEPNEGSSVRFFTSATLRPQEEVPGEVVGWLPTFIAVEYEGGRPVTGVWKSVTGGRRVCWYAAGPTADLVEAHAERYEAEPFWIVDRSETASRRVRVIECDGAGHPQVVKRWEFDVAGMPTRLEQSTSDSASGGIRTFRCTSDGTVYAASEHRPGAATVALDRPIAFPIAELAGEPFPCGGTIGKEGPRLVEPIIANSYQARMFAVYRDGADWKRGLATMATSKAAWSEETRPVLEIQHPKIAPLVQVGALVDRRHQGYSFFGVVEALPNGRTLDDVVCERPLGTGNALALALEIAEVARVAHARGHQLGGIRPELVYVNGSDAGFRLSAIAHRGPSVISATYSGEQVRWPPVFACDFSSPDDARGLAQLVWYALTGAHPFLAPDDMRWDESWNEFRHRRTRRQPWSGPAAVGEVLERVLFEAAPEKTGFEWLVGELHRLRATCAPYR
jgi:hypothetical protein